MASDYSVQQATSLFAGRRWAVLMRGLIAIALECWFSRGPESWRVFANKSYSSYRFGPCRPDSFESWGLSG